MSPVQVAAEAYLGRGAGGAQVRVREASCAYQGGGVSGGIVAERGVWVGSYVDQFCIAAAA